MHKGLIIGVNPGHRPPKDFLLKALKDFPSSFGGVISEKGKLEVSFLDTGVTLEQLDSVFDSYKDKYCVFFLGNFPAGYSGEDIQPFNAIVKHDPQGAEIPRLVTFMSGGYTPFARSESSNSNAFHAFKDMVQPLLKDLYDSDAIKGDIDKLMNTVHHDVKITKTFELLSPDSNLIVLVADNGDISTLVNKNTPHHKFDWGWTSDHLGFATQATGPVRKLFNTIIKNAPSPAPAEPAPAQAPVPPAIQPSPPAPKTDTTIPPKGTVTHLLATLHEREKNIKLSQKLVELPANKYGKQLKNWCNTHLGYLPSNYKLHGTDGFVLTAYVSQKKLPESETIKSFQDPQLANAIGRRKPTAVPPIAKGVPTAAETKPLSAAERLRLRKAKAHAEPVPVQPTAPAQKPVEPVPQLPNEEPLPLIPKEEIAVLQEWTKKFTGYDGKEIHIDPEIMVELTKEIPSYAEQVGRNGLEMLFYWSMLDIADHRKKFPKATDTLIKNLINLYADALKEIEELEQKVSVKAATTLRRQA